MTQRSRTEEIEQAKLIKWTHKVAVRELMPCLKWLFHVPNGGLRSALAGAQMKALGVKRGVPDLILPFAAGGRCGLVIEMKAPSGRTSTEQIEWMDHFNTQGWHTVVARSAQEARNLICQYLSINPDDVPAMEL